MSDTPPNLTFAERECYEAATKATPGPYTVGGSNATVYADAGCNRIARMEVGDENDQCANSNNFALNANPITVHARLRELSDLRGKVAALTAERERLQHIANELADGMANGIQWLRNIRDGVSNATDALSEMSSNYSRIRGLQAEAALREEAKHGA